MLLKIAYGLRILLFHRTFSKMNFRAEGNRVYQVYVLKQYILYNEVWKLTMCYYGQHFGTNLVCFLINLVL